MRSDDLDYFRHRASEEQRAAAACEDNAVAIAHLKMADEYPRRVDNIDEKPRLKLAR